MPSLRSLHLEFNAHSGEQYSDMLIGIENLLNIQEVAGRIGAIPGSEESDRTGVESAFKDAIVKHSKLLAVNVQMIDWVDEDEEISQFSDLPTSFCSIGNYIHSASSLFSFCSNRCIFFGGHWNILYLMCTLSIVHHEHNNHSFFRKISD
ncbi:unnamed protein product, partial [Urochloa humidicola]